MPAISLAFIISIYLEENYNLCLRRKVPYLAARIGIFLYNYVLLKLVYKGSES